MLTPKNAIIGSATVLVVAVIVSCLSLLGPPDSDGFGQDSYGTRAGGYRALFDVLDELGIDVERSLTPPDGSLSIGKTVALIRPHVGLVGFEPDYLKALSDWVIVGGRLVVTPPDMRERPAGASLADGEYEVGDLLSILDLGDVTIRSMVVGDESDGRFNRKSPQRPDRPWPSDDDSPFFEALIDTVRTPGPARTIRVASTGTLADIFGEVKRLSVPGFNVRMLECGERRPQGALTYTREASDVSTVARPWNGGATATPMPLRSGERSYKIPNGIGGAGNGIGPNPSREDGGEGNGENTYILAASYAHGDGEVVLLADARLLTNRFVGLDDNSLFAVRLISPNGQAARRPFSTSSITAWQYAEIRFTC